MSRAEAQFLRKVQELHPEAEGKPVVVGNCQAGWAIMLLAAAAPELVGVISIAGSPLSWAGVEGKNPMRYTGGLLGGTWLTSLCGDLGNGKFDGAYLVENFENLNPANTLWTKYNLYSKIDTEEPRYLGFEKWWGGYFRPPRRRCAHRRRAVRRQQADQGHDPDRGSPRDRSAQHPRADRGDRVLGDNITPPQQALYWIADLYESVAEIVAHEQTIIYTLDQRIGHLGIFVSAKVAGKQHAELVNTLDLIEALPPGLYEMILEEKTAEAVGADLLPGQYLVRFEGRTIEDILALGDGREHEQAFATVARISEINEGLYDTFLSPWVRLWSNEASAEALRLMHPLRLQRFLLSDLNPAMWPVRMMADLVRKDRRPAAPENAFVAGEHAASEQVERALEQYGEIRDRMQELTFKTIYNSPWSRRSPACARPMPTPASCAPATPTPSSCSRPRSRRSGRVRSRAASLKRCCASCSRWRRPSGCSMCAASGSPSGSGRRMRRCAIPREHIKAAAREQAFMLRFDRERALAALPKMLPTDAERRRALDIVRRIGFADGEIGRKAPPCWPGSSGSSASRRAPKRRRRNGPHRCPGPEPRRNEKGAAADRGRAAAQAGARVPGLPCADRACAELDPVTTAVAHPCDGLLTAAVEAAEANLIRPILVGPRPRSGVAEECGLDLAAYRLVDTPHSHASAAKAVELVRAGEAET